MTTFAASEYVGLFLFRCRSIKSNSNWLKPKKEKKASPGTLVHMSSGIAGSWWSSDFLLGGFTSQAGSSLLWQKWLQESFSKTTPVERAASASRFQQEPRIVSHWPDLSHDLPMELDLGFNLS